MSRNDATVTLAIGATPTGSRLQCFKHPERSSCFKNSHGIKMPWSRFLRWGASLPISFVDDEDTDSDEYISSESYWSLMHASWAVICRYYVHVYNVQSGSNISICTSAARRRVYTSCYKPALRAETILIAQPRYYHLPFFMDPSKIKEKIVRFRILIIGTWNAGKTREHPEIFNSAEEKCGEHDIENEMVFRTNPGFIFHDSRGFEAGGESEYDKVNTFIKARLKEIKDRIHTIWYCIPMDQASRYFTKGEVKFSPRCNTGSSKLLHLRDGGETYMLNSAPQYPQSNCKFIKVSYTICRHVDNPQRQ
ncbi:hypothetical protein DEU56DRAFT_754499 [Suillus clintonianus]|uniref:uncharacterized protein n=1 Tax=Suillus clintonianus TaxID=1904413 RepID=UPI001B85CBD9|nr:uncharacterized protein DEU56DRAFT_754499 [Suillus clintonianus]KAG2143705.1 hypothetical protein DEU56DRAFT_754499 [Suillus clintonianus]